VVAGAGRPRRDLAAFIFAIALWLAFTVLFANFAEALAEGRSRAQASALRNMRQTVLAKKMSDASLSRRDTVETKAEDLRKGDVVLVQAGEIIPWMAKSSKARHRWMKAPLPGNRRR